jgi:hypothetical protein
MAKWEIQIWENFSRLLCDGKTIGSFVPYPGQEGQDVMGRIVALLNAAEQPLTQDNTRNYYNFELTARLASLVKKS